MGYGISTNALFGVMLDGANSKKLRDAIVAATAGMGQFDDEDDIYSMLECLSAQTTPYQVAMIAEDSDSRIHNTTYEEDFEHGFGLVLADKGYGGSDSSSEFKVKINQDHSAAELMFNQVLAPLLAAANVSATPELVVVSYTA